MRATAAFEYGLGERLGQLELALAVVVKRSLENGPGRKRPNFEIAWINTPSDNGVSMSSCRFAINAALLASHYITKFLCVLFEIIGWLSIVPIIIIVAPKTAGDYTKLISIISQSASPDGKFVGVVMDCWPQVGFGLQTTNQNLIVHLVRPEQEGKLTSLVDSCDIPETAMLSTWKENLKDRPLLRWLSASNLEVMVPDGSDIILFKTKLYGITVNFVQENTYYYRQRRGNETLDEPSKFEEQFKNYTWIRQ